MNAFTSPKYRLKKEPNVMAFVPMFVSLSSSLQIEAETDSMYNTSTCLKCIDEMLSSHLPEMKTIKNEILTEIEVDFERDCNYYQMFSESLHKNNDSISIPFHSESILGVLNDECVYRTTAPLLNSSEIALLRNAAEKYWLSQKNQTSRFTYQQVGNLEVHVLKDLKNVTCIIKRLLQDTIFPFTRNLFPSVMSNHSQLSVYDALIIRYDSDLVKNISLLKGSGQPLHRDLGIVSVNIALNDKKGFDGGGTFFEHQLSKIAYYLNHDPHSKKLKPLLPKGAGHAIFHPSFIRHAGAATSRGIRDILVIFLTAKRFHQEKTYIPSFEMNARLKAASGLLKQKILRKENVEINFWKKVYYQRLAVEAVLNDGEAWHFLGMSLLDLLDNTSFFSNSENMVLDCIITCLETAKKYTPFDERVYNNLGIVLQRKYRHSPSQRLIQQILQCFHTSILFQEAIIEAGCQLNYATYFATRLNLGLFYANRNEFQSAYQYLTPICNISKSLSRVTDNASLLQVQRIVLDAIKLRKFCYKELEKCTPSNISRIAELTKSCT